MGLFKGKIADVKAASAKGHEDFREARVQQLADLDSFHAREAAKYDAKAESHEAKGDHKGAARARKVAERNRRLAVKHAEA
jgi:hypothetical protein